jgi:hypothetical protein
MSAEPEFQVFRAVVEFVTILVMYSLVWEQGVAYCLTHDKSVLRYSPTTVGVGVIRRPEHTVALFIDGTVTFGPPVRPPCQRVAVFVVACRVTDTVAIALRRFIAASDGAHGILAAGFSEGISAPT